MKALRTSGTGVSLFDVEKPRKEAEALIRVSLSGICNTDLEIAKGYAGFNGTLGHEFVGVVEESPEDESWIGKRVLGEINVGCRECQLCRGGDSRHCPARTVLGIVGRDGCHAEFTALPLRNLVEVPDGIPDERAVFAEPLAAAHGILEQVSIDSDTRVAVVGDGKLGILCAWSLGRKSQHLFLVGKHPNKLRIGELGDAEGILLDEVDGLKSSFDIVVEASGSESGFETALDLLKPRGKMILKSTYFGKPQWEASRVVIDEITIIGSRCGMFSRIIGLLKDESLRFEALVTESLPLNRGVEAFGLASEGEVMKVLLHN